MIQQLRTAITSRHALLHFDLMAYFHDAGIGVDLSVVSDEAKVEVRETLLNYHKKFKDLEAKCALAGGHVLLSRYSPAPEVSCLHCGYRPTDPDGSYASRTYLEMAGKNLIEEAETNA